MQESDRPFFVWRHLNKLRWLTLFSVLALLVALPYVARYQNFVAAHAYDLLTPEDKRLYDVMELLTSPLTSDPERDLDAVKGTTWSGTIFGLQLSDPLAAVSHLAATLSFYDHIFLTALIPVAFTLLFGRFFCGWLCPAGLLYELNSNLSALLHRLGVRTGTRRMNPAFKYVVLAAALLLSAWTGSVVTASIYPPAIVGRELQYAIALGGFGAGAAFFAATLLFDLLVARRGFCRYLCPGGALYVLLGSRRLVRIRRDINKCNDCAMCNAACEFALSPMEDEFGRECSNCTACISHCATDALSLVISPRDVPYQGPGRLRTSPDGGEGRAGEEKRR